jgi:Uma2 family endonuclease
MECHHQAGPSGPVFFCAGYHKDMATRLAFTAEQLALLPPADDGARHEIDGGELIEMTLPNRRHGRLQVRLARLLGNFLEGSNLGELLSESGFLLARNPDILRAPDLAFVRASRLTGVAETDWIPGSPDLAIEIISPSETARQIDRKVHQYLAAGTLAVWVIYPDTNSIHVFEPGGVARVVEGGAVLTSPAALPGFAIPADEIFGA